MLPTGENKKLVGLRENGQMLYSEAEIVELRSNVRIERIFLLDGVNKVRFEALSIDEKRYFSIDIIAMSVCHLESSWLCSRPISSFILQEHSILRFTQLICLPV